MLISAGLMLSISFFIKDKDHKTTVLNIGTALFSGVFIFRFFKGTFGYKPTLHEIEENQFDKKNEI